MARSEPIEPTFVERLLKLTKRPGDTSPASTRLEAYALGQQRAAESDLPGELVATTDLARFIVGRLELLTRNAVMGLALVFGTLLLLLSWRVSLWVAAGLTISLLGTLAMMRLTGTTLNLLTMFGLIIVIGILVDDAIVVAENIKRRHEEGEDSEEDHGEPGGGDRREVATSPDVLHDLLDGEEAHGDEEAGAGCYVGAPLA